MTPNPNRVWMSALAVAAGLTLVAAPPAGAVTSISSSGYGLGVNLTVLGFLPATLGPIASDSGSSPPGPYSGSNSVLSLNTTLGLGSALSPLGSLQVGTGVLTGSASSPFMSAPTGTGTGTVNNITSLNMVAALVKELGITATTISSTSNVSGAGSLQAYGSTTIEDLVISGTAVGSTITVGASGAVNPTVDDTIFDSGGLDIVLNMQVPTGANGPTSMADGITTDALYIDFTNFALGTGVLNGDVVVGESQAGILGSPVIPEPGTWALMLVGFAGLGAALRARRRTASASAATQ
jgi:hypothetical protein